MLHTPMHTPSVTAPAQPAQIRSQRNCVAGSGMPLLHAIAVKENRISGMVRRPTDRVDSTRVGRNPGRFRATAAWGAADLMEPSTATTPVHGGLEREGSVFWRNQGRVQRVRRAIRSMAFLEMVMEHESALVHFRR